MKTTMKMMTLSATLVAALSATAPAQADETTYTGLYLPYEMLATRVKKEVARRTLQKEFTGPEGPTLIKAVKQGNPKVEGNPVPNDPSKEVKLNVPLAVNAVYPDAAPFSTVPPSLLLKLPPLPEEARYRFVGRALILRDTEANVILDFIPDVVPDPTIPR